MLIFKISLFGILVYWRGADGQTNRRYVKLLSKSTDHRSSAVVQFLEFYWSQPWFIRLVTNLMKNFIKYILFFFRCSGKKCSRSAVIMLLISSRKKYFMQLPLALKKNSEELFANRVHLQSSMAKPI